MAGETKVVQMRYPVDLLDAVDSARALLGQTRTEFVLGAVRARLGLVATSDGTVYTVEVDETDGAHNVAPPGLPPDSIAAARARTRERGGHGDVNVNRARARRDQVSPRFKKK